MKFNPNDAAFTEGVVNDPNGYPPAPSKTYGLTKYEYLVGQALAGLCASPNAGKYHAESLAKYASEIADATVKELSKAKV